MGTNPKTKPKVKRDFQSAVKEVLQDFDFIAVHRMMKAMNWRWGGEIPLPEQIRHTAESLLMQLEDGAFICSATGGLEADWEESEGTRWLRLRFIFSESTAEFGRSIPQQSDN